MALGSNMDMSALVLTRFPKSLNTTFKVIATRL